MTYPGFWDEYEERNSDPEPPKTSGVKQVIVIRKDLKMRRGKEIAQGAHASMEWLRRRVLSPAHGNRLVLQKHEQKWLDGDFRKVVCQVASEKDLVALHEAATAAQVESWLITDHGLTEFGGKPTVTALAIGPNLDSRIDAITRDLKLY